MNCEICDREFKDIPSLSIHIRSHKISSKDYYDKYFKKENEGICYCGKQTNYKNMNVGYHEYCSVKCLSNDNKVKEKIKEQVKGDNHWTRRTGEGPNKGKTFEEIHGEEKAKKLKSNISKWYAKNCIGPDNPFYGKYHNSETKELIGSFKRGRTYDEMYGLEKAEKLKQNLRKYDIGHNYRFTYPRQFYDKTMRLKIITDQTDKCGICFKNITENIMRSLHHINYIKKDIRRRNLIFLCKKCHGATNGDRNFWKGYLRGLNREIIRNKKLSKLIFYRVEKKLDLEQKHMLINRRVEKWQFPQVFIQK